MADPTDDGSGNSNKLIPLLRRLLRNYGVCVILASIVLLGALITDGAMKWNARPSWIEKVLRDMFLGSTIVHAANLDP